MDWKINDMCTPAMDYLYGTFKLGFSLCVLYQGQRFEAEECTRHLHTTILFHSNKHSDVPSILVREGQHVGIRPDASHGAPALSLPSLAVFACPQSAFTTHEVAGGGRLRQISHGLH